jgi:hypothetical protein
LGDHIGSRAVLEAVIGEASSPRGIGAVEQRGKSKVSLVVDPYQLPHFHVTGTDELTEAAAHCYRDW